MRRRDRFKTAIFSLWFRQIFTLKSLLEELKCDFDGSKIVSLGLQVSCRFLISRRYFAHLNGLCAENIIPDLLSSAISI